MDNDNVAYTWNNLPLSHTYFTALDSSLCDRLQEQESRLEQITAEQGSNVQQLVAIVKENKEIQTKMKVRVIKRFFLWLSVSRLCHSTLLEAHHLIFSLSSTHKAAVQAETVQSLVKAVLASDMNADASFSDREINVLYLRLKNLPGIRVNETALKRSMGSKAASINGVFALVKDLEQQGSTLPEEERVFSFADS